MTLEIDQTAQPKPRWAEATTVTGFRRTIEKEDQLANINLNERSPVPFDIRLKLQKAGATVTDVPFNFRLPWGEMYVCPRINDGDKQAKQAQLDRLARIIAAGAPQPVQPPEPSPLPVPADPSDPTPAGPVNIKAKITDQIEMHEAAQHRLIEEAGQHEAKVNTYRALLDVIDKMPDAEGMLATLMTPPEPPKPELPPPPPERITERAEVSKRLVLLATQTFDRPFSLDTLVAAMTAGKVINEDERKRVRACVANVLTRLTDDGEVKKVRAGERGKTGSAQWERVLLPGVVAVNGVAHG